MKNIIGMVAGLVFGLASTIAGAASIDTGSYGYVNSTSILDEEEGSVFFTLDYFDAADFGFIAYVVSDGGYDAAVTSLDYTPGGAGTTISLEPATEVSVMATVIEMLFEDDMSGLGYLLVIELVDDSESVFGAPDDFTFSSPTDPFSAYYISGFDSLEFDAKISLDELSTIPLPATLPMLLGALGLFAVVRRHI